MSTVSKQVEELRKEAFGYKWVANSKMEKLLRRSADTIGSLSAKLAKENIRRPHNCEYRHENGNCLKIGGFCTSVPVEKCYMERPERYYSGGWILCEDRLPTTSEYMGLEPTPYMKRLEIAYMTDTVEYLIGFYDGSKWMDKRHNIIKNVIAWKQFLKLPQPYKSETGGD